MTEYIERKAAIQATNGDLSITGEENMLAVADYIQSVVQRLRQAQGVELIRCKECKCFSKSPFINYDGVCSFFGEPIQGNDFCSYAEREGK